MPTVSVTVEEIKVRSVIVAAAIVSSGLGHHGGLPLGDVVANGTLVRVRIYTVENGADPKREVVVGSGQAANFPAKLEENRK